MRKLRISFLIGAVCAVVTVAGCSIDNSTLDEPGTAHIAPVVVGAGSSDESAVLAQVYATVLRSTGADVSVRPDFGDRAEYLRALDAGDITVVPEFTGELLAYFDSDAQATAAADVFEELSRSLPQGLSVSDYASAEDRSVMVIGQGDPRDMHELGDLAPHCATSTVAVGSEFEDTALASIPGCTFGVVHHVADDPAVVEELRTGVASVGGLTTLSPVLATGDLEALSDDEGIFRAQNVVPLYRSGTLAEPQLEALTVVAGELTSADLSDMLGQVRDGKSSVEVARTWFDAHA